MVGYFPQVELVLRVAVAGEELLLVVRGPLQSAHLAASVHRGDQLTGGSVPELECIHRAHALSIKETGLDGAGKALWTKLTHVKTCTRMKNDVINKSAQQQSPDPERERTESCCKKSSSMKTESSSIRQPMCPQRSPNCLQEPKFATNQRQQPLRNDLYFLEATFLGWWTLSWKDSAPS
jgi:hypothetical protein